MIKSTIILFVIIAVHGAVFWFLGGDEYIKGHIDIKKPQPSKKVNLKDLAAKKISDMPTQEKWLVDLARKQDQEVKSSINTYCLPYKGGNTFLVSQVQNGRTHKDNHRYAYDFVMSEGTPIHASRGGYVVQVIDHYHAKAQTEEYKSKGNFVMIQHQDQTYSIYAHLSPRGANVNIGDHIQTGELVAYSGNTGYSSGPHLHFEVFQIDRRGNTNSLPVIFISNSSGMTQLKAGKRFSAKHSCQTRED